MVDRFRMLDSWGRGCPCWDLVPARSLTDPACEDVNGTFIVLNHVLKDAHIPVWLLAVIVCSCGS